MRILIYGGSFNPPHIGHRHAVECACRQLQPDKLLIIPSNIPPHKATSEGSSETTVRFRLTQLAFSGLDGAIVDDREMRRDGPSYSVDTLEELARENPGAELVFLMGTDMLLYMEKWRNYERILQLATLAALPREADELPVLRDYAACLEKRYGARILILEVNPVVAASTELRQCLPRREGRELLPDAVYEEIIRLRLYGAKPSLDWLREKVRSHLSPSRVPHVDGCEQEAIRLAARWGASQDDAAEAGILHDITKKLIPDEQLQLCEKYGIINDTVELSCHKLLHAKTGAVLARELFGVTDEIRDAIRWHTTARPEMTLLEQIVYMADYIEQTRHFPGVETLRELAYKDLDEAMILGLQMSLDEIRERGTEPHGRTISALNWFISRKEARK